ncbi:MAG: FliM/FliN family flagellar motor switch protein [Pseudomonadota bacterium]
MNMAQTFAPARAVAQHCAELTERGPRPEERAETIASWRRDIGRALAEEFAGLLSGGQINVTISEPEWQTGEEIFHCIGPIAANSLLRCGLGSQTLLLSFDYDTAIALTDRSFGGDGSHSGDVVESLPRSAALLIDQASTLVAQAIASASQNGTSEVPKGDVIVRSESATRLKPFGPQTPCALFTVVFAEGERAPWTGLLAISAEQLDGLLPGLDAGGSKLKPDGSVKSGEQAFGAIPLPLKAVLAEFDLSLSKLEKLAPGDEIPISVSRDIPLRLGSRVIAHGSAGTQEDRMALCLTRTTALPRTSSNTGAERLQS